MTGGKNVSGSYGDWLKNFIDVISQFGGDELYDGFRSLLSSGGSTIALNHKVMEKAIDVSWVEAIENGLVYVDNVMRNPRKTIENVEEVVPIALSKKITVDSIKHLAQHTDLIQSVDPKTGKITPSKVLNVHKEESMMTYENKFVNTLIDRLYIFINRRYEKLKAVSKDEEVFAMEYNTALDASGGRKMNMTLRIETVDSLETTGAGGATMWERVEKIRSIIESYKASPFCQQMGANYIRPPVMRTNAIMKNVDLKACLTLWQFIESYDKVGYEINVSDSAQKPSDEYIQNLYSLTALNFLLFRSFTRESEEQLETLKTKKGKSVAPKILKKFDKDDPKAYNLGVDAAEAEISSASVPPISQWLPADADQIMKEIDKVIAIERKYIEEEERKKIEAERIAEEKRRKQEEEERRRREEERRKEEERILALEKAERERKEREEKERLEAERIQRERREREEKERLEAERIERERMEREEKEKREAERAELERMVGEEMEKREAEHSAQKAEEEAKRLEREERERVRAEKLKAMRSELEKKSFEEIYADYSKNPVHVIRRSFRRMVSLLRKDGLVIREGDTDTPMLAERIAAEAAARKQAERDKAVAAEMSILYEKYAPNARQRIKKRIKNLFRKKKKKVYVMPKVPPIQRTPEEQKAHDKQIKALFKEYHVSVFEKAKRKIKDLMKKSY